jgi:hypothetical protein
MPNIRNYEVSDPPTSDQVEEMLAKLAINKSREVDLWVRDEPNELEPNPEESPLSFRVISTRYFEEGGTKTTGETEDETPCSLQTSPNLDSPASISVSE